MVLNSEDIINLLIAIRFVQPFIISFLFNTLFICYELNTGFEHILNERNSFFNIVFTIMQTMNAVVIGVVVIAIVSEICWKYHFSKKTFIYFGSILSIGISWVCLFGSFYSLLSEISADSRLKIQCSILLVTQIGLILFLLFHSEYIWKNFNFISHNIQ